MTFTRSPASAAVARPVRKSPLRVATFAGIAPAAPGGPAERIPAAGPSPGQGIPAPELRRMQISEFAVWLRSRTNKHHRPFQADTIAAYADAARALNQWMTSQSIEGDFTACDTAALNRFFADYLASHGQGGTNTRQRNLRHLFTWLEESYGHPHPYTSRLHRYAPVKKRPATLAQGFIDDLLEVTGGGRARGFEDVRDHAMIRGLTEGVRRTELIQQELTDLSSDLIAQPFVRVQPLKGGRAYSEGRIVPMAMATARAYVAYLRVRRSHRLAASPSLWLGTRNRGPMTGSGLYQMLRRRADQAGYDPDVHPHQFRDTFANDWLEGDGAEGDLMRLMGWSDRSMLDLYAQDMQMHRPSGPSAAAATCTDVARTETRIMSTVSRLTAGPGSQRRDRPAAGENPPGASIASGPGLSGDHAVRAADRPGPPGCTGPDRSVTEPDGRTTVRSWPLLVLAAPAAVAVWSGWVGIGQMTGFGEIRPLPGIWDSPHVDTAVTLPVGVEAYAAFALRAWLTSSPRIGDRTRRFARWSAIAALVLGMAGQVAYHLLRQAGTARAPWEVTTLVSCLPVLVLGLGSALAHLLRADAVADGPSDDPAAGPGSASQSGKYRAHASHHPRTGVACRAVLGRHPSQAPPRPPAVRGGPGAQAAARPVPQALAVCLPNVTGPGGRPGACVLPRRGRRPRR